jgi:chromate reductase
MSKKVAVFVGSLRKDSLNRKMAKNLIELAGKSLELTLVEIGDLPFYNQDLDDGGAPPAAWTAFRDKVKGFDALLFVSPEYNRGLPAVLKNAVDVGSRPYGKSVWDGKPAAVVTVSPGAAGGFGANHSLRQSLVTLNVATMPAPEAYVGNAGKLFDAAGAIANEDTKAFLKKFMDAFAKWVE